MPPLLPGLGQEAGHADRERPVEGAEGVPGAQAGRHGLHRHQALVGGRVAERLRIGGQGLQAQRPEGLGIVGREGADDGRVGHGSKAFSW
ncbi:hypothetical protein STVA_54220 [Allostella vacuolata]|nr:hypothetical protein STVA_54220 [Stella vacuolata]